MSNRANWHGTAILTPEQLLGPYFLDDALERSDIREGQIGVPLTLHCNVIDMADGSPVRGARFELWQADRFGIYSDFEHQGDDMRVSTLGETWLRGHQFTGNHGDVTFQTIWPGWYLGRTTHIHYQVILEDESVLTSQIYFPDSMNEYIYLNAPEYQREYLRDTLNRYDRAASEANEAAFAWVREESDGYLAGLTIGIDRSARSPREKFFDGVDIPEDVMKEFIANFTPGTIVPWAGKIIPPGEERTTSIIPSARK